MRIIIIGAVAAGTSAATKARRNDSKADIIIYEKDYDISYASCGLPYYIGGDIEEIEDLEPRSPQTFRDKYGIEIKNMQEVTEINTVNRELTIKNLYTGENYTDHYDKLIIATGAKSIIPDIKGINQQHVFTVRSIQDAIKIKNYIKNLNPESASIIGTGFIGLEMLDNLVKLGIKTTLIDNDEKLTSNLEMVMAEELESIIREHHVPILKNAKTTQINSRTISFQDGREIDSDLVILAIGLKPEVTLAEKAGIELGETGAIRVTAKMETNISDIYACGDCIETFSAITGKSVYVPLGTTANKTGRIAGDSITGGALEYRGNLGTSIFKIFDYTVASTGLNKNEAIFAGYDVIEIMHGARNKPAYMEGEKIKIVAFADKRTRKLLGVQMIGKEGVDKRLDVYVTLITYEAVIDDLFHLDLAYAPPYSNVKDLVHYTGMIFESKMIKK